jgi:hypothetical protein
MASDAGKQGRIPCQAPHTAARHHTSTDAGPTQHGETDTTRRDGDNTETHRDIHVPAQKEETAPHIAHLWNSCSPDLKSRTFHSYTRHIAPAALVRTFQPGTCKQHPLPIPALSATLLLLASDARGWMKARGLCCLEPLFHALLPQIQQHWKTPKLPQGAQLIPAQIAA